MPYLASSAGLHHPTPCLDIDNNFIPENNNNKQQRCHFTQPPPPNRTQSAVSTGSGDVLRPNRRDEMTGCINTRGVSGARHREAPACRCHVSCSCFLFLFPRRPLTGTRPGHPELARPSETFYPRHEPPGDRHQDLDARCAREPPTSPTGHSIGPDGPPLRVPG